MTIPVPTPTPNGVFIPLSLAVPLFHCYFGNGPRYLSHSPEGETPTPVYPPDPTTAPRPPVKDELDMEKLMQAINTSTNSKWVPRGNAASVAKPPTIQAGDPNLPLEFGGLRTPER